MDGTGRAGKARGGGRLIVPVPAPVGAHEPAWRAAGPPAPHHADSEPLPFHTQHLPTDFIHPKSYTGTFTPPPLRAMFKLASVAVAVLLAASAVSAQMKPSYAQAKVNSFQFCARPVFDSYTHQPFTYVDIYNEGTEAYGIPGLFLPW